MDKKNIKYFIISLLLTVFILRVFIYFLPTIIDLKPIFIGFLLLVFIGIFIIFQQNKKLNSLSFLFGIGTGIVTDESIFFIIKEKTNQGYWDNSSIFGMLILLIAVISVSIIIYIFTNKKENEVGKILTKNQFFSFIFFISLPIILSRVGLFLFPNTSTYILGYEIHHIYTGALIIIMNEFNILFMFNSKIYNFFNKIKILKLDFITAFLCFGIGLIIDEFTFLFMNGRTDEDYWSIYSVMGSIFLWSLIIVLSLILFLRTNKIMITKQM